MFVVGTKTYVRVGTRGVSLGNSKGPCHGAADIAAVVRLFLETVIE